MNESVSFPVSLYIALAVAGVSAVYSFSLRSQAIGVPMLVVVMTVAAWYFGDAFYNDYNDYVQRLGWEILEASWWQVALFLVAFCIFAPFLHRWVNKKLLGSEGHFLAILHAGGLDQIDFQERITRANGILAGAWISLMFIALLKTNFDFLGMFSPYIAGKAQPWSRGRIGGGFDAFVALAGYIQIMLTASFGIIFALSKNPRTRMLAGTIWFLSAPWFFLDRTRNTMLAVLLPGLLTFVFLRLRVNLFVKVAALGLCFLVVEGWMKFVIQTRSTSNVAVVVQQLGLLGVTERVRESDAKHAGLNMFEELAWCSPSTSAATLLFSPSTPSSSATSC
jgi:hypothetical protein